MVYRRLSSAQMNSFHSYFANLFREAHEQVDEGVWTVNFIGKPIQVPLNPHRCWLDWDYAVSILGHDAEIKRTYASLIMSSIAPDLFVDIGANYGTHSLL